MTQSVQSLTHVELRQAIVEASLDLGQLIGEVYSRRNDAELAAVVQSFQQLTQSAAATIDTFDPQVEAVDMGDYYDIAFTPGEGIDSELLPEKGETMFPETLSVRDAADYLGIKPAAVHKLIKTGRLKTKGKSKQGTPTKITQASFNKEYKRRNK
jgi:hypothetical protein